MAKVNTIRKKNVIRYNNEPCLVLECNIRTPPNMASFCQMSIRNLVYGKVIHVRCPPDESFEVLDTDTRKVELSYESQGTYHFLDNETYETYEVSRAFLEDVMSYLVVGRQYELFFVDGNPLTINLPSAIDMKVVEAADAIKGDTAGNVQKPVKVETGLTVMTPLFIKLGDVIRISTEDGSYLGRA